jgi:hypothetical protein
MPTNFRSGTLGLTLLGSVPTVRQTRVLSLADKVRRHCQGVHISLSKAFDSVLRRLGERLAWTV